MKKFLAILLAFCMVFSMAACGAAAATEETTPAATEAPAVDAAPAAVYTAGTYTAQAQGFGGPVTVEVTVDANAITDFKVSGHDETPEYGGMAMREMKDAVLAAQGVDFDTVSAATYTKTAARLAMGVALDEAKGTKTGTVQDGKYTVEVVGHEGLITVSTMFVDGKITKVTVPANNETVGVGTYAVKYMPARIVESQSVNCDGVTGASVSSAAIKQGVAQAIVLAGGNVADFQEKVETPVAVQEVPTEADVVIMGAGTAGIMAAARLVEAGVTNVVMFEKSGIPGGCFATAYGGFNNTDSQTLKNWGTGAKLQSDVTYFYEQKVGEAYAGLYDTYVCEGLPIGPICNPSRMAIQAALNPTKSNYYYFVSDINGVTYFASTLEEHNKNIAYAETVEPAKPDDSSSATEGD